MLEQRLLLLAQVVMQNTVGVEEVKAREGRLRLYMGEQGVVRFLGRAEVEEETTGIIVLLEE